MGLALNDHEAMAIIRTIGVNSYTLPAACLTKDLALDFDRH
jgi:hypothetical protein